jgi:hydroxyethylthiazole kinase-like uncharacterized protein yjeF
VDKLVKVVTAEQMRLIDSSAGDIGLTTDILMENAGRVVAVETNKLLGITMGKRILILIGPGNNGGDGLVAARYLQDMGAEVNLYLCGERSGNDHNYTLSKERNIPGTKAVDDINLTALDSLLINSDVVIDAIFGTGRSRGIDGTFKQVLTRLETTASKNTGLFTIAVDLPSGLDADTGAVDPGCPKVDATITLGYPKPGLFNSPGAEMAGKVIIADIGIPATLSANVTTELISEDWIKSVLPPRPAGANKGTFGKAMVAAGSINYVGAAYLACMGAARVGTGLVTLATAWSLQQILASKLTEVTYLPLPENEPGTISASAAHILRQSISGYGVLLLGCGLGQSPDAIEFIKFMVFNPSTSHLVLDADALNTLARVPQWWQKLSGDAILTPHPGEMSRLTGIPLETVQRDRLSLAQGKAREWQKVIVLKGAYTIIAAPDGRTKISTFANTGLASAGTGDVLSGIIAGLVAQGMPLFEAAACGVYLHGKAGTLVSQDMGDTGMLASDLLPVLPKVIKNIKNSQS